MKLINFNKHQKQSERIAFKKFNNRENYKCKKNIAISYNATSIICSSTSGFNNANISQRFNLRNLGEAVVPDVDCNTGSPDNIPHWFYRRNNRS